MGVISYNSNNSGGRWWLEDADWQALQDAGWVVHWLHEHPQDKSRSGHPHHHGQGCDELVKVAPSGERWLGALARSAARETNDPAKAIAQWERITGQDASDLGCGCCGPPHNFVYTDNEGKCHYGSAEVVDSALTWS